MNDQPKNGATISEVLETVNAFSTRMEQRFDGVDRRFDAVDKRLDVVESDIAVIKTDILEMKSDISEMKIDITDLKGDVRELNETAVTKDYLNSKVQEFRDDSTIQMRKTNDKVATVVRTLRDKSILSDQESQGMLELEPFPLPK